MSFTHNKLPQVNFDKTNKRHRESEIAKNGEPERSSSPQQPKKTPKKDEETP